jgi:hypothetical protein
MLARAAAAVKHANQLIRALIITAAVICADETPIRVGPAPKARKRYLLVAWLRFVQLSRPHRNPPIPRTVGMRAVHKYWSGPLLS